MTTLDQVDPVLIYAARERSGVGFDELEKLIAIDKLPVPDAFFADKVIPIYGLTRTEREQPDLVIPATFVDCLRLFKVVYLSQGQAGYRRVIDQTLKILTFRHGSLDVTPLPVDSGGGDEPEAEELEPGEEVEWLNPREIHDLFLRVDRAISKYKKNVHATITPIARQHGLKLLKQARDQVTDELIRYFSLYGHAHEIVLSHSSDNGQRQQARSRLFSWVEEDLNRLEINQNEGNKKGAVVINPEMQGLVNAVRECHPLYRRARRAMDNYNSAKLDALQPYTSTPSSGFPLPVIVPSVVSNQIDNDPGIKALKDHADDAREQLIATVMAYGVDYPVIWRMYSLEALPVSNLEWLKKVYEVLDKTLGANNTFVNDLNSDEENVWNYPLLIKRTIKNPFELSLPPNSIAYTAALERAGIEKLTYIDIAQLGVAGTQMAFIGAALLGLVAVSNPISFAIVTVDIALSLLHAYQTYVKAAAQQAGMNAVLIPTDAPSGEPDWFWVGFEIIMDLTAVIP